jgi:hypothetical protein
MCLFSLQYIIAAVTLPLFPLASRSIPPQTAKEGNNSMCAEKREREKRERERERERERACELKPPPPRKRGGEF